MKLLNRLLWKAGLMIVPAPPSAQMLRECSNIYEHYWNGAGVTGGLSPKPRGTTAWLREVGNLCPSEYGR